MNHLGKVVAVVFAASLVMGGVADAKTTKNATKGKRAKVASKRVKAKKAKPKQDEMLLPLVGKKSPFGNLAPAPVARKTTKRKRAARVGLGTLHRRANLKFNLLSSRASKAALPSNQTVLRMSAEKLKSKDVNKVVGTNVAQIHACYERAMSVGQAPTGSVSVKFVVEPNGSVSTAAVSCGKKNRALKRCMERRIRTWKFPKADAPTTVDFPFVFDVVESKVRKTK